MHYCSVNAHINSGTKASILCKNLVKIDLITSEFKKRVCGIFAATGLKFDDRHSFGMLVF